MKLFSVCEAFRPPLPANRVKIFNLIRGIENCLNAIDSESVSKDVDWD